MIPAKGACRAYSRPERSGSWFETVSSLQAFCKKPRYWNEAITTFLGRASRAGRGAVAIIANQSVCRRICQQSVGLSLYASLTSNDKREITTPLIPLQKRGGGFESWISLKVGGGRHGRFERGQRRKRVKQCDDKCCFRLQFSHLDSLWFGQFLD